MELSRRTLLKSGLAVGAVGATVGRFSLAAYAVSGAAALTTLGSTLLKGAPGAGGYRPVVRAAGEPHLVRTDLGGRPSSRRASRRKPILAFAHITDVHVIDVQSPARVE